MAVFVCPVQCNYGCDLVFTHTMNKLQKIPTKKPWIKQNNNAKHKTKMAKLILLLLKLFISPVISEKYNLI